MAKDETLKFLFHLKIYHNSEEIVTKSDGQIECNVAQGSKLESMWLREESVV